MRQVTRVVSRYVSNLDYKLRQAGLGFTKDQFINKTLTNALMFSLLISCYFYYILFRKIDVFAAILFVMGLGCVLARRNLIMILIGVEIMLNAAAVALVGGSAYWRQVDGQVFVVFLMAMTSAEVAISLAMVVYLRRRRGTLEADKFDGLRG